MIRLTLPLLLALATPCLTAAGGASSRAAPPAGISASGGWVRQTPPNRDVAAGYLRLANDGEAPMALVGAESADPADADVRIELHTMLREDGMMRMRPLDRLDVPVGGSATLAPGGTHLMLFGADATRSGTIIDVELQFLDGTRLPVALPVRRQAPGGH